jgi:putative copper export protein
VAAGTLLIGGAALLGLAVDTSEPPRQPSFWTLLAYRYEWVFWGSAGVIVASGVGNLGAFGAALPGLETKWGHVLAIKIALVLALLAGSVVRTLTVVRVRAAGIRPSPWLPRMYLTTAALGVVIVGLAEELAHG